MLVLLSKPNLRVQPSQESEQIRYLEGRDVLSHRHDFRSFKVTVSDDDPPAFDEKCELPVAGTVYRHDQSLPHPRDFLFKDVVEYVVLSIEVAPAAIKRSGIGIANSSTVVLDHIPPRTLNNPKAEIVQGFGERSRRSPGLGTSTFIIIPL